MKWIAKLPPVWREAAAVPHTPLPISMRTQAGRP